MDRLELYDHVLQDLNDRASWDERQRKFFEMRHHGLRRQQKPWPGASDVHIPIGDMAIERIKPYYFQQLFATDLIATFIPNIAQNSQTTTLAAQYFDHCLKQKSNLETEVLTAIDHLLVNGKGILKARMTSNTPLTFDAVDPQHLIVPTWTKTIEDADRVCHVQTYSKEAFLRAGFDVTEAQAEQMISSEDSYTVGDADKRQEKRRREGLTYSPRKDQIIVWEIWSPDRKGNWQVDYLSPQNPSLEIKKSHASPYDFNGAPFVELNYEIKDAGWYASRGVMEQIAVFEVEATRLQNEKNDCMTLYNRPLFRAGREVPNSANLRFKPGSILPYDIAPVPMPQPPISFDVQMSTMRELAQQRVTTPDFGISTIAGMGGDRRTATEIQAISGLHQQSSDLRMRIFRHGLGKLYRLAWSLLLQYAKKDLNFWYIDSMETMDPAGLHNDYGIIPSGSADGVNKPLIVQKAFQRYQLLQGNPFIDLGELTKSVIEVDDATLVRRLYRDPGHKAADQAEDQAHELAILRLGFPAVVRRSDDHPMHIQTILQYMRERAKTGAEMEPLEIQSVEGHLAQHVEALRQTDKAMAKSAEDAIALVAEEINAQQTQGPVEAVQAPPANQPPTPVGA